MKKIVFLALCLTALLMLTPNMTAYAASTAYSSRSFVVANWKGEVPEMPPTDEEAAPANEPEDEHSGDDAKREAKPAEPEDDAPPAEGAIEPEDAPTDPNGEQHTEPMDEIPPVEDAVEPEDEQSVFESEENEQTMNEQADEAAPAVDDTSEDDSENEVG